MGAFAVTLFVAFGIVVAVVIIRTSIEHSRRTDEAWARAADRLALRYQPGNWLTSRKMCGTIKGFHVVVNTFSRSHGKSSSTYTRIEVSYPSLALGLRLTKQGFFNGVASFLWAQDIHVGDADFDNAVVVKGGDPQKVIRYLTPALRLEIRGLLMSHPQTVVEDHRITWESLGVIDEQGALCREVRYFVDIAAHLTKREATDPAIDKVIRARDEGRPEESLRILIDETRRKEEEETTPPKDPGILIFDPPPADVEKERMKGELQYLAGKKSEATATFEKLSKAMPHDEEIKQWAAHASATPSTAQQPPTTLPPDVVSVCRTLFNPGQSSFDATALFEKEYRGKDVAWKGRLHAIEPNAFDFVFGGAGGTRATFEIGEASSPFYDKTRIFAVVHITSDVVESHKPSIGSVLPFTGRLHKIDGLMSNLFLTEGKIEGASRQS